MFGAALGAFEVKKWIKYLNIITKLKDHFIALNAEQQKMYDNAVVMSNKYKAIVGKLSIIAGTILLVNVLRDLVYLFYNTNT